MLVFYQDIAFTNFSPSTIRIYLPKHQFVKIQNETLNNVCKNVIQSYSYDKIIYYNQYLSLDSFKTIFSPSILEIDAAGGMITNDAEDLLMIFRKGKWDLPKGKHDPGESFLENAIRECKEECGIHDITFQSFLETSYHVYKQNDQWILKKTHWYALHSNDHQLTPQTEENITNIEWVKKNQMEDKLKNTYASVEYLIRKLYLGSHSSSSGQ